MSKVCQLTGKGPQVGNKISHSERKTRRRFLSNVSKRTIINPATGKKITLKVSTRALRTLAKNPGKFSKQLAKLEAKKRA